MEKKVRQQKMRVALLVVLIVGAVLIFTAIISSYLYKFENALIEENSNALSEIAGHITINMQTVGEDIKKGLEVSGLGITAFTSSDEQMIYLNKIKEKYDFEYLGYVSSEGEMMATMNSESKNIATEEYFQKALQGESVIEYTPRKIFKDRAISGILLSVPVYDMKKNNEKPIAVLVAMMDIAKLNEIMNVEGFNGQGYTYIIDMKGEIILHTKSMDYSNLYMKLKQTDFKKNYSVEKMIRDISSQKEGFAIYSDFGIEKYMYYQYLGIDSWSIVTVIEKNAITAKTTELTKELIMIGILIMILFPTLLLFAVFTHRASVNHKETADAKTAFLANMSHEIRTPMNAIVGISEILLRENITGKQKNYVLSIVNAGNGLLTIINDILDISKIESGKFLIVEEEYELESLIYDIMTIVVIKIGDKPIEFMFDLDSDLPKYVTGDMVRVKQVLLNIINNAVKFTNKGYIKLGIHAKKMDQKLELTMPVEDTGRGIQKKDLDRLFISFNQVDTHKSQNLEGTGLGLAISKRLCEMMQGDITVKSDYEKGSVFTITIKQAITRPEKLLHISKQENFRLLLLEEKVILQEYFSDCLDKMKLEYDMCSNEEAFIKKMNQGGYTHILAKRQVIKQLKREAKTKSKLVTLLKLEEQSLMEDHHLNVYVPLFILQLAAVLYNRTAHPHLLKRTGIDILAIQPMPFITILLVDDNEVNLQVANGLMNPYYMSVDCALSGKKAIEMIQEKKYDLVFMDHMMPEMDGVEAVKIMRSLPDENLKTLPIVALTANVTYDARELFLETGFDDFLAKPIETVKLNDILKHWLKAINDSRAQENPEKAEEFQKKIMEAMLQDAIEIEEGALESGQYVDFDEGIKHLGNPQVYCDILKTYCRSANEKLKELPELLETDLKSFIIEIHGLKGSSAGISSKALAKTAGRLEKLGKENQINQIREELLPFLKELEKSLEEISLFINRYVSKKTEVETEKEIKKGPLPKEILKNLKDVFLDYDTENIKLLLEELQTFSYDEKETELLLKLQESYEAYEFELPVQLIHDYQLKIEEGRRI